eukprot:GHVS01053377.1.p1 GENE.GHVS01053377.1~~GHVS01053377.1.p1  ORF type:complete len:455 (+),score=93.40 GHVS01053377.1:21-1385(+)
MEGDDRLKKAIALAQQAAEKDKAHQYEEALDLYRMSLDNWQLVCKYQTNSMLKERLYKKMEEYVTRAEKIKQYLQQSSTTANGGSSNSAGPAGATTMPPPTTMPSAGGGKPTQGGGGGGNDDGAQTEEDKMKDKLGAAIVTEKPNVMWSDIAGLEGAKEALQEAVILPTRFPQLFTGERKPWKGILLYGPPGTGKTYLAKACATEAAATFLSVSSADLVSKWQGESEKLVRSLFEMARERKPSIVFIDEVDSMCSARSESESESSRRIKTEFLVQMQGMASEDDRNVLILGASNVPWELDAAIRRRFERRIYIPLPDVRGRKRMFQLSVAKTSGCLTDADFSKLASLTEGYSGADISIIVRDALFQPVRKCRSATHFREVKKDNKRFLTPCSPGDTDPNKREVNLMNIPPEQLLPPDVTMRDFMAVMENARPSVGEEDLCKHVKWTQQFGLEGN